MNKKKQTLDPKFEKNITALFSVNPNLVIKLLEIDKNKQYEIFQGKDSLDINFLDTKNNEFVYVSPLQNIEKFLQNEKDSEKPPFRYFFGIGNGIELHTLCSNDKIKRVVIMEPNVELIYIVLNLLDYSTYITSKKLHIEHSIDMNFSSITSILEHSEGKVYAKLFELETFSSYYEKSFSKEFKRLALVMSDAFYSIIISHGNCAIDSLMGISHHIKNLPKLVTCPRICDFSGKANAKTAVIVSTGPSLSKQIPLLKKIQNYVTIICVDASFPILEKHGIKPDFVTVLERIPETGKFFKNNKKKFQDDVNFVLVSIVHEDIINAIRGGNIILQMRPHSYTKYFKLDDFGYLGEGMSAANLAHDLAYFIDAKNIILIGQDLAFGEDNTSHAEGHLYGEDEEKIGGHELFTQKYGGEGKIRTTHYWILFRNYFERSIAFAQKHNLAQTFNATEGGAKIPGSVEITFKDAIKNLVDQQTIKKPFNVKYPTKIETESYTNQFIESLNLWIKDSIERQEKTEETFLKVQYITEKIIIAQKNNNIESLTLKELLPYLDMIDEIKSFFDDKFFNSCYRETVQTYILSIELDLVSIPLIKAKTEEENLIKVVDWIMQHTYWLFSLAGGIQAIRDTILQASMTWNSELQKRLIVPNKKEFPIDEKKFKKLQKLVEEKQKKLGIKVVIK